MRVRAGLVLVLSVLAALLAVTPQVAAQPSAPVAGDACESVMLETYRVKARVAERVYRLGDIATFSVRVKRAQTEEPVAGARVGLGVHDESDRLLVDYGKTDDEGRVSLAVRLRRRALDAGYVRLMVFAWNTRVDNVCAQVTEYGYVDRPRAFRVTP